MAEAIVEERVYWAVKDHVAGNEVESSSGMVRWRR